MNRKEAGFTLIELLITMAVLATLAAIALPSFSALLQRSSESATYHLLTTSLATARLRAVKDNAPVTVCPSADGSTCRSDGVWSDGWILYRDPDRDPQPPTADAVIQRLDDVGHALQLRSTPGRHRVRFLPSGWAYGSNLTIRLCRPGSGGFLGSVIVNNAGRPRTERQPAGSPCPFSVEAG
ncbi:GspH/FimT family pseudopilin [Luteimonas lutimaris]|uniref:Type II secretion system protein H n=1 Tax=Luteimonas lutimaris TaxID=698645 RepID=A0ABP7MR40_9GAMM